jgi:YbbR domain-containing protein
MNYRAILNFIIKDPIRKIFAIIFAFGLWFFVAIDNNYQYEKEIKIVYTDMSESLIIVDSVPKINIILTGRGGSLLNIWAAPPKARCNLSKSKIGENKIPVKKIVIPIGFSDVKINYNTPSISIKIDKKISKKMKINVPIKDSLKEGYSISDIIILDTIDVIGPRELLQNLNEIATETLNIRNKSSTFTKELKIAKISSLFQMSKDRVQIQVKVDVTVEKLFTNISLKLIFTPNQRVSSEKIFLDTLIVSGSRNIMEKLRKRDLSVKIKLTEFSAGEYNLPASIILPDHIKPVYSNPERFKIKIY